MRSEHVTSMSQSFGDPFSWSHLEQQTAVQFERAQTWVKKVTGLWGKVDGERTRCPRCKGSGLNTPKAAFGWRQAAQSDEACWFCEGVGVMPIAGLNGLMLARCDPVLSTRDFKRRPPLPIMLQLYLGKFPGTRCKTGFYKPGLDCTEWLYDPSKPPAWSKFGTDGCVSSQAGPKVAKIIPNDRASLQQRELPGSTPKVASSPRVPILSRTSRPQWSAGRSPRSWKTSSRPHSGFSHQPHTTASRSPRTPSGPQSMSNLRRTASPNDAANSGLKREFLSPRSASQRKVGSYRYDSPCRDSFVETGSPVRSTPLISSPRSAKSPRKERNRIREKAEKEAMERARRIQRRPLIHRAPNSFAKPEDRSQEGKWLCKAGEWLKKSSSKSYAPSSESSGNGFQYKDIPWINNLVYGKLKENVSNVLNSTMSATKGL
eukprot:TRINITY_DN18044_c0_g1_i1.p1 TRINITY_DN18044_c0_g1~~TRINITY_DN18044_c0_g1_i1.p1  ORF type:complete len:431 (-),score=39.70 TRINITY_DN18044_c0_g1_i1:321-1613(-)